MTRSRNRTNKSDRIAKKNGTYMFKEGFKLMHKKIKKALKGQFLKEGETVCVINRI